MNRSTALPTDPPAPTPDAGGAGLTHNPDWVRVLPFIGLHLACLGVWFVGVSGVAVAVAVLLYAVRMFAITGGYHRYFSHRSFRTSRAGQFALAVLGASAVQRGALWWAAHHRHHHAHADEPVDIHSPRQHGLAWSHAGWIASKRNYRTRAELIPDLLRFPELRFLNRWDVLVPGLMALALYGLGAWLAVSHPGLGTSGWQLVVWGACVSTIALFHGTCTINSLSHRFGRRRYETTDDSRNNPWLALITFGEGWHNNHHRYPAAVRQAHRWWELDITWHVLVVLSWLGLVWDLKEVPEHVLATGREAA